MPELPDIEVYVSALRLRVLGCSLRSVRLLGPFVLRTVAPPLSTVQGGCVTEIRRMGKRIVLGIQQPVPGRADDSSGVAGEMLFLVFHLMVAGRLRWTEPNTPAPRSALVALDFDNGTLVLAEAGTKHRASLHLVDARGLAELDPGGMEVVGSSRDDFSAAVLRGNHTLKRVLTDPHILSGIGNAYSDEILHRARLSPLRHTSGLTDEELGRLHEASIAVLEEWTARLLAGAGDSFPTEVTAFRSEMCVHGRFGKPCPVCGDTVRHIVYSQNECDYCPRCQTGGRIYADRALSRLLKDDWRGSDPPGRIKNS